MNAITKRWPTIGWLILAVIAIAWVVAETLDDSFAEQTDSVAAADARENTGAADVLRPQIAGPSTTVRGATDEQRAPSSSSEVSDTKEMRNARAPQGTGVGGTRLVVVDARSHRVIKGLLAIAVDCPNAFSSTNWPPVAPLQTDMTMQGPLVRVPERRLLHADADGVLHIPWLNVARISVAVSQADAASRCFEDVEANAPGTGHRALRGHRYLD